MKLHLNIKEYFKLEGKPRKGLMPLEWVMAAYLVLTSVVMLFTFTKLANPEAMLWGRIRVVAITAALWGVYRMLPCRLTLFARVAAQLALLAWWYPDTYEFNRMLPNLDHVFAQWEHDLFGCQPSVLFHKAMPWAVWSELMNMGYFMYYPMIGFTVLYYFCCRYREFERASFVVLAAFFLYYIMYIFVPVAGPTFYFDAVGLRDIAQGIFPSLGDYFNTHTSCLPMPGYENGLFYHLVEDAKAAGERPTAAFPSSHVGISTVCMLLLLHVRCNRKILYVILFVYLCLCLATVYIQAHYLIDALAGLLSGALLYLILMWVSRQLPQRG